MTTIAILTITILICGVISKKAEEKQLSYNTYFWLYAIVLMVGEFIALLFFILEFIIFCYHSSYNIHINHLHPLGLLIIVILYT